MQLPNTYVNRAGETVLLDFAKKCDLYMLTVNVLPDCVGVPNIEHIRYLKQRVVRDLYKHR